MSKWLRSLAGVLIAPERLNDTWAYQQYLRWRFPAHWQAQAAEKRFYQKIVTKVGNDLVFDIGANAGHKAVLFKAIARKVICLEPDTACVGVLRKRFANVSIIEIVAKGVADREGELEFKQIGQGSAYNTFSEKWLENRKSKLGVSTQATVKVPITTLDSLIVAYGQPNLIKIDVEGFELQVLLGLSHPVPYITFECNLPIFEQESIECIKRLTAIDSKYRFNWTGHDDVSWGEPCWLEAAEIIQVIRSNQVGYLEIHCSQITDY